MSVRKIYDPSEIDIEIEIEVHDHKPASYDGVRCRFCNEKLTYDAEWDQWLVESDYQTFYSYTNEWLEWLRQVNQPCRNITRSMYERLYRAQSYLS